MTPRPLELFDLPKLPRLRDEIVSLDCAQILTRGNPLRAVNFLAHLNPTKRIYTAIHEAEGGQVVLGSIRQQDGEKFARMTYLAPEYAPTPDLLLLVEELVAHAKAWGVHQVVAEVQEDSPVFAPLRQSGFSIYARQRVWEISKINVADVQRVYWRRSKDIDSFSVQRLLHQIVPPLLQPIESFYQVKRGLVCEKAELLAYIDTLYGRRGIFLRPLIHPNTDKVDKKLRSLLARNLANRHDRPVYFCVRSYQAWIEPILEEVEANVGPRQVLMVKHLAGTQRAEKTIPAGADKAWANPAAPIRSTKIKVK